MTVTHNTGQRLFIARNDLQRQQAQAHPPGCAWLA